MITQPYTIYGNREVEDQKVGIFMRILMILRNVMA